MEEVISHSLCIERLQKWVVCCKFTNSDQRFYIKKTHPCVRFGVFRHLHDQDQGQGMARATLNIFQWLFLRHTASLPESQRCSCSRSAVNLKHFVRRNRRVGNIRLISASHPSPPLLLVHAVLPSYISVQQSVPVWQIASSCPTIEGVGNSDPQILCCVGQSETWPLW